MGMHINRRHLLVLIAVCWLSVSAPSLSSATEPAVGEYDVKAVFLYNFAKFVDWPDNAFVDDRAPLAICVLGDNPFGRGFDPILTKTVNGRPVTIREIDDVAAAGACHLLFISASEQGHVDELLSALGSRSVLTVSDMKRFARSGGMISLFMADNKIRFEINTRAANRAGLRISSQLLKLARSVIE
jgi:hypothetical protein